MKQPTQKIMNHDKDVKVYGKVVTTMRLPIYDAQLAAKIADKLNISVSEYFRRSLAKENSFYADRFKF